MDKFIIRVIILISMMGILVIGPPVLAGQFRVAAIQTTTGRIGYTKNNGGYQLRMRMTPLKCGTAQLASKKYTIHIGPFDEIQAARNAARLWALYE